MATQRQIRIYEFHRRNCQFMGIGQSTLTHKSLQGSLAAASPTGNVVYTGPGPAAVTGTQTAVWMVSQPINVPARGRPGDETAIGRQDMPDILAQIPAIDDNQNAVTIAHDDLITDVAGITYRIADPTPTPENSMWVFTGKRQR